MLLPMTLPTATSALSVNAACRLTPSSGALVPNATTVNPITRGETRKVAAIAVAPCTSNSPPPTNKNKPNNVIKILTHFLVLNITLGVILFLSFFANTIFNRSVEKKTTNTVVKKKMIVFKNCFYPSLNFISRNSKLKIFFGHNYS